MLQLYVLLVIFLVIKESHSQPVPIPDPDWDVENPYTECRFLRGKTAAKTPAQRLLKFEREDPFRGNELRTAVRTFMKNRGFLGDRRKLRC